MKTENIRTAIWTPSQEAKQRGAKTQQLKVYLDREASQIGYVVVSKINANHVFSVHESELTQMVAKNTLEAVVKIINA